MRVAIARAGTYEPAAVASGVSEVLTALGGMASFVRPGERVLIKPNMLEGLPPEKAVTTHPEIVRAVIREVKSAGGTPLVGDSPGVGGTIKAAAKCGILAVCNEEDVPLVPFDTTVEVSVPQGTTVKRLVLAKSVLEADKIISVAKMKTHSFTGVTGAVKNLFGCIVDTDKAQFHLRMKERKPFAGMLVDLARLVNPVLAIVDGIVGMEGNGPRNGHPKPAGVILGGADCFAVDQVMAAVMGLPTASLPVNVHARQLGLGADLADIEVVGSGREVRLSFIPPHNLESLEGRIHPWLVKLGRSQLTTRPVITAGCVGCGRCAEHCPPQAMTVISGRVKIDYSRCIRCYCCQELCPADAVRLEDSLLLQTVRRILR